MNIIESFNRHLFLQINATPDTPHWLLNAAVIIAEGFIYLVPLLLIGLWLSGERHRRALAMRVFLVAMGAVACNQLIGLFWFHPRPFMIGLGHTYLAHAPDSSFPSDHLTVMCSVVLVLFAERAYRLGMLMALLSIAVAWARIFLGVHYPLDMLGALAVSGGVSLALTGPWRWWGQRLVTLSDAVSRRLTAWLCDRVWHKG